MKEQYVGDINDYRKYALLRVLSDGGRTRVGVCWMLTPDDGGRDGNKLGYLQRPEQFRHYDPELFDILAQATAFPDQRRLLAIEASGVIPGAVYFNDELKDKWPARSVFMQRCFAQFHDTDLVFFDPDNGLEVSLAKGRKNSSKYVYLDELEMFFVAGKSLLVYQHFPRVERRAFIADCAIRLRRFVQDAPIWAFTTSHVVFLLVINPNTAVSPAKILGGLDARWPSSFIHCEQAATQASGPVIDSQISA